MTILSLCALLNLPMTTLPEHASGVPTATTAIRPGTEDSDRALGGSIDAEAANLDALLDMRLEDLLETEVDIASAAGTKRRDLPYDITVISAKEIAQNHYLHLADSLSLHSGFSQTIINPAQSQLTIRGNNAFQKGTVAFLINGHQKNFDIYNITPWASLPVLMPLVDRVEVIQGAVPFYGRNATSGALNVVMKKEVTEDFASIEYLTGTFARNRVFGGFGHRFDNGVSLLAGIQHHSVDSSFNFNDQYGADKAAGVLNDTDHSAYLTNENNENFLNQTSFYGALHKKSEAGSAHFYAGGALTPNAALRLPDRICLTWIDTFTHYEGAELNFSGQSFGMKSNHRLSLNSSTNRVRFIRNGSAADSSSFFNRSNPSHDVFDELGYRQPSYRRTVMNANYAWSLHHGADGTNSIMIRPGVSWTQLEQENFFGGATYPSGTATAQHRDLNFATAGISLQVRQGITERLRANLDLRMDENYLVGLTYGALGALNYAVGQKHSVRVAVSMMTRPPDVEELNSQLQLYLGSSSKTGQYFDNPDLKPERNLTAEVGFVGEIAGALQYQATAYYSKRDEIIELEFRGTSTASTSAVPRYRFQNANSLQVVGGRVETTLAMGALELRSGISAESIIHADGHLANAPLGRYGDNYLPPLQGFGQLQYGLGNWLFAANVRWVLAHEWLWPSYQAGSETLGVRRVRSQAPIGLRAEYVISDFAWPARFFVMARNILDARVNAWRHDKAGNYAAREILAGAAIRL